MRSPTVSIAFLPLAAALIACDTGSHEARAGTGTRIDTIAGVEHLTHTRPGGWPNGSPWRADAAAAVEIGAMDGAEPYVFGSISGIVVDEDGRILVADGQAKEVRVFSASGDYLERFGRDGEGPGEFRNLSGLGRGPDGGVAVLDGTLGRVSIFDTDHQFVRSLRLERPFMMLMRGAPVRFDRSGRYHDLTGMSRTAGVDSLGVIRYAANGALEDTVLVAVHEPQLVVLRQNGRPMASFPLPFAPVPSSAVGPDGQIYVTRGDEYRIAQLGPRGDTVRVIHRTVSPIPVSASKRESARTQLEERYQEIAGTAPRDLPAIPDRMPAISALRVDEEGYLWAYRPNSSAEAMEWDVYDQDGGYVGIVSIPMMHVMHIGKSSIAGAVYDEMEVPRVRVIPLVRG